MRKVLATAAVAALAIGGLAGFAAPAAQAAAASHGCPSGAVCIYPGAGWNGDRPTHSYYSYGAHNLRDMYGVHRVFNNQTDGATVRTCTGYNGSGCQGFMGPGWYIDKNLTPINSITLQP
ncbi:hypothetical protein ACIBH1_24675 [Nonomuraea sp. NPDC050663]|uniref:hypothetical protein n=1 Tax=Nonomuraea sp. NPDC050663 TaxID=3364370 RepID=UPI00379AD51E